MKRKAVFYFALSLILLFGLTTFLSATNPYEEKLLGVWITDRLDYAFLLKEDNICDVIDYETYFYEDDIEAEATWSAGYREFYLTVYLSSGDSVNKFLYEYVSTFLVPKTKYTESEINEIIQDTGIDGFIATGFIDYTDYYILYTSKKEDEVKKQLEDLNIELNEDITINREDFVKSELVESNEEDFDPTKENLSFMLRLANSGEELIEMNQ
jgi:hypothetical protein